MGGNRNELNLVPLHLISPPSWDVTNPILRELETDRAATGMWDEKCTMPAWCLYKKDVTEQSYTEHIERRDEFMDCDALELR